MPRWRYAALIRSVSWTAEPAPRRSGPIALSYASRLILERIGAWSALAVTPIDTIHVSQHGAFGRTMLGAVDAGVPALGYVVEYAELALPSFGSAPPTC